MKRIIVFILLALFISSCSFDDIDTIDRINDNYIVDIVNNSVSISDVHRIIARDYPQIKSQNADCYKITSYVNENIDTLMYIVNFTDGTGWRIYSSDKRTPAILAEGDKGYFSIDEGSPALKAWMSCMSEDIARVRESTDAELIFSNEEITDNKSYWASEGSRFLDYPLIESYPKGHWEVSVSASTVEYDRIEHMVAKWDQYAPYNECCPYYTDNSGRACAGCVAIAGAQVLFYLNNKIGVPSEMYSSGSCSGNIDNYYKSFSNPSTSVWGMMSSNYQPPYIGMTMIPEAILIGYVGQRVNMHYCDNIAGKYSWAVPRNLQEDLFEYHGITCTHGDYDEEIVKNSLLNQMPVIVSASDLLVPVDGDIHCFVIDGYRRTRTQYAHHHYYVVDEIPTGPYMIPDEYMTYTYSSPQLVEVKINWGWWTQWDTNAPVNDGWYTLTGNWVVSNGGESSDYNYHRKMIYGFDVAQ